MPTKKRTTSKAPSAKQLRSRAINGVLFLLAGIAGNINVQTFKLSEHGRFPMASGYLATAKESILNAILAIKQER